MRREKSCGVIPFIVNNDEIKVMLIKQTNNVIGFPKGHVEVDESEEETALRECLEETNTKVSLLGGYRHESGYYMEEYDAYKTVVYFLGEIQNDDFSKQENEVSDIYLCTLKEAFDMLVFDELKDALTKAVEFIKQDKNL